ncbi:protein MCM10 homolog [Sardina pilchardus]|uniref:protein MCM10 homolog n=1 Tax=Sardina pilchardus TaxID=27697 RepID=UPI002E0E458F
MADDDNLDLLLSMFDESPEEQATSGGGEDNFDDLFDNENDDEGEGYVEPEEEKVEEAEEPEEEEESHNRSKEDLEAELRRMQEKMQALQEQLQASQGGASGSGIKSPPPKPKNTSSASTPKPKGASTSTPTNRTAVTSCPAPKATKTPHTTAAIKPSPTTPATKPSPTTAATKPSPTAAAAKLSPTTAATKLSPTAAVAKSSPPLPAAKASPPTAAASTKKPRAAHQPKAGGSSQIQSPPGTSGIGSFSQAIGSLSKVNSTLKSPPPSGSTKPPARQGTPRPTSTTQDVPVEKFSGLRIRKPRISSIDIEHKMSGRKLIQLSQLPDKIARDNLEDSDWVTFAVLVNKMTPQSKNNGKTFSIWKLNDLQNLEVYISFFLFGNVHTELWKTDTGTVIGILNPNQLKNKEGSNSNEVTLTIDHPQKVLILGEALDFGTCKAMKKNGDPCTQLVNMYKCQYCQYHVQAQYKKLSSKRAELQSSFTGTTPKGRGRGKGSLREKLCQSDFHYAGMSSLACAPNANGPQPKKPTQSTLNNIVLRGPRLALQSDEVSGCSDDFKGLLSQPTPGALNIKRHLGQVKAAVPGASSVQSISALDLLKQQKAMHKERMLNRQKRAQEIQQRVLQSSGKATPPARPLSNGTGVLSQKPLPPPSPRLADPTTPTLGRGLSEGDDILFELSPPPPSSSLSAGKMAALRKLHSKGAAITKDDPNAVKRKRVSSSDIAARVEKNRSSPEGGENSAAGEEEEPAQKKRRAQLEYVQSEEFQRILNAKSKFSWLMGEMEVQVMQEYFEPLVQKEQMEEKMRSIREQKCRAVTCKSCKYTHFKPADRCVQENHDYHWHDAHKRFFKCPCGQRKISLARIPNMACSNCGQFKWERDGMLKEKKGPKIGGELLMPRGDEQPKFLNSMK